MRKHQGINKKTGKLKKNFKYTGKKLKSGIKEIKKVPSKPTCKNYLKKKIKRNLKNFEKENFKNKTQALAISYSQVKKNHPQCKRVLKK